MQISSLFPLKMIILIRRSTFKLLCFGVLLAASLWLLSSFYSDPASTYIRMEELREIRITSTEYPFFSHLADMPHAATFKKKRMFYKADSPVTGMPSCDFYTLTFVYEDRNQVLLNYSPTLNQIFNNYHRLETSPGLKELLLELTASYRQEACKTYGTLLVWEEADKLFPMYATARITDIYTRASFTVQRREGISHVDAQPLTAGDTAIMKEIYGGKWSWERKGIIVEVRGRRIAASMNGMPHGSGKIDDNNFPGHFCIHFLGSTIHSGGMDTQHHREILKAAGKLPVDD